MDQPAQNYQKNQKQNLKKAGVILLLILFALGALLAFAIFLGNKPETPRQNTQNTQQQESTKGGGTNQQSTVYGRVIKVDVDNRIIEVETQDVSKKIYKIKVENNVRIERPPVSDGRGKAVVMPATFESILLNSIVNILVRGDLNKTGEFTAIQIMLVV